MLLGASWLSVDDTFDLRLCRHPSKRTQPLRQCEGASVDVLPKEAEHVTPFCKKKMMLEILSTNRTMFELLLRWHRFQILV